MAYHQTMFYPLVQPPRAATIDHLRSSSQPLLHTTVNANGQSPPPSRRSAVTTTATTASTASPVRGPTMLPSPARNAQPTTETCMTFFVADIDGLRYLRGSDAQYVDCLDGKPKTITVTGYEVYIIEQWACARCYSSSIISYTGNPEHVVTLGSITVPKDRDLWSKRLRAYVEDLSKMNARPKSCDQLGTLFVTNLSSFQSGLTLINVPDGNASKHSNDFIVNENLRRMGCGGRSGITLNKPADASRDKFYQIYRLSDHVPFENAVINIVKLVQVSLYYFGLFRRYDINGLLCDLTESAINAWWHDIGVPHYRVDPADKVLGPTTIAAILGMVVGCRHRLNAAGAQVAKDPFDVAGFRQGIVTFQRQQKLSKTAKLDGPTRDKLLRFTGKISASERFALTKVVKTTVQDLSGMHTQNAIDVETTDYDRFIENIYGHSLRYLWLGKMNSKFARQIRNSKYANVIDDAVTSNGNGNAVAPLVSSAMNASGLSNSYQTPRRPLLRSSTAPGSVRGTYGEDSSSLLPTSARVATSSASDAVVENESDRGEDEFEENENYDTEGQAFVADGNHYPSSSSHVSAYDDVPAFVRYHRNRRINREETQPLRRDIKTAMRRGKVRTDEAIRSGVNKLTGNLRRRRDEQHQTSVLATERGSKRITALVENDNTALSAGTSTPPSTATDGSTPTDVDPKGRDEVDLIIPERDEDEEVEEEEEDEYDQDYDDDIEESEYLEERDRVHSSGRLQPRSIQSGGSRNGSELAVNDAGSSNGHSASTAQSFNDDSQRLEAIENELMIYHDARSSNSLSLGPRTARSCFDLVELAAQQNNFSKSVVALGGISVNEHSSIRVCGGPFAADIDVSNKVVRRASFSVVEPLVSRWDAQWDYPTEYIFRLLERVKAVQQWSESHVKRAESIRDDYALQMADLALFHEHAITESDAIQQAYHHAIQREGYLANGIRDLDMEAARLQYEVRTLDAKLDDLDESVDSFGAKIEGMESRLQALRRRPGQKDNKAPAQLNGKENKSINGGNGKHECS
ncbi:uncharacterized protein V1513DRAFT_449036 [Lipomyces chichibuensis]|uniref:uncharacterized protein n=1 Tax=Lipomyces chichibuensis TaxID=1546026 RepID=UPI00334367D0